MTSGVAQGTEIKSIWHVWPIAKVPVAFWKASKKVAR